MAKYVALYLRASNGEQTVSNQQWGFEAWAPRCGYGLGSGSVAEMQRSLRGICDGVFERRERRRHRATCVTPCCQE